MLEINPIKAQISSFLKQPVSNLADDTRIVDLVKESFILVEMMIELQEELGIFFDHDDLRQLHTVGDLVRLLEQRTQGD